MIGEIRDEETAAIAVRAALIGRMVLSILRSSTLAEAVTRLKDLGVAQYLIDATLRGVLGQSLVAQVCEACSGEGCDTCSGRGRDGRTT